MRSAFDAGGLPGHDPSRDDAGRVDGHFHHAVPLAAEQLVGLRELLERELVRHEGKGQR